MRLFLWRKMWILVCNMPQCFLLTHHLVMKRASWHHIGTKLISACINFMSICCRSKRSTVYGNSDWKTSTSGSASSSANETRASKHANECSCSTCTLYRRWPSAPYSTARRRTSPIGSRLVSLAVSSRRFRRFCWRNCLRTRGAILVSHRLQCFTTREREFAVYRTTVRERSQARTVKVIASFGWLYIFSWLENTRDTMDSRFQAIIDTYMYEVRYILLYMARYQCIVTVPWFLGTL